MTEGRVQPLLYNGLYSLLTLALPLLVSLIAIPILINGLGKERFGVLALSWVFVGYLGLFDMGLGRATTHFVADYRAQGKHQAIPHMIWTAWIALVGLGFAAGLLLYLATPLLVGRILQIPDALALEAERAFWVVAATVPLIVYIAGMRGVLEGYEAFKSVAFIAVPLSTFNFLIPLLLLPFTRRLDTILLVLLLTRCLFAAIYLLTCFRHVPGLQHPRRPGKQLFKLLFSYGGWLTVTNLVGPLMTYLDRFWVGAFISVTAVTHYATSYDIVSKISIIPVSLLTVLFARFSHLQITDKQKAVTIFYTSLRWLFLLLLPTSLLLAILASDLLTLWIDADFAAQGSPVIGWLAIGFLINGLAAIPFAWIQASGRADVTARYHLLELPLYLGAIWLLAQAYGIVGVAMAWVARSTLDAGLLFWYASRKPPIQPRHLWREMAWLLPLALALFLALIAVTWLTAVPHLRLLFATLVLVSYSLIVWHSYLTQPEKRELRHLLQTAIGRQAPS
jgi:O-antigen/teichoic acid export membrane protein